MWRMWRMWRASAKLEVRFVDVQSLDTIFKRGRWNSELRGSPRRPGNSPTTRGEHGFDGLSLGGERALRQCYRRHRLASHRLRRQPRLVDGEHLTGGQNHGPLDDILQLTDV